MANRDPVQPGLAGRSAEQAFLVHALEEAQQGNGRLVLISGEAGIGKTTLVQTLANHACNAGALVLTGSCYDLTTTSPYGPWVDMLDMLASVQDAPQPPATLRDGPGVASLGGQPELFAEVREFVRVLSTGRAVVLVLEDMQWADATSLDLLRYLGRQLDDLKILVVVTYRSEEVTRHHYLYQLLPMIVRETKAARLELSALDRFAVEEILAERYRLIDSDRDRLAHYLLVHAEGNPFYTVELLRTLEEDGLLSTSPTGWWLDDLGQVHVPTLIQQVVEQRLFRLRPETREFLELVAVIGHVVPLDPLLAVCNLDDSRIAREIEQATEKYILAETSDPAGFRFVHALTREALYQAVPLPRRRVIHRQIADALAALPRTDPNAVAHHYQQAGDDRAAEWLVQAGERAQRTFAAEAAVTRYLEAVEVLESRDGTARQRGWLLYRAGRMLRLSDGERSLQLHKDARALGLESGDSLLAGFALADGGVLRSALGEPRDGTVDVEAGIAALDEAEYRLDSSLKEVLAWTAESLPSRVQEGSIDAWASVRLGTLLRTGRLMQLLTAVGRFKDVVELGERYALDSARLPQTIDTHAFVQYCLGSAYAHLGMPDEARNAYRRSYHARREVGNELGAGIALYDTLIWVILRYETDDLEQRRTLLAEVEDALRGTDDTINPQLTMAVIRMPLLYLEGDWMAAREILDSPVMDESRALFLAIRQNLMIAGAMVLAGQGETERAWTIVRDILIDGPRSLPADTLFYSYAVPALQLAIRISLDIRDLDQALEWLEMHDHWLAWSLATPGRPEGNALWAQYHAARGDQERALEHARSALEFARQPRQPLALTAALRTMGTLLTSSSEHDAAADHLNRSLELAKACNAPYEQALTTMEMARLRIETGNKHSTGALLDEAEAICTALGAQPALDQIRLIRQTVGRPTHPAGLTPREVDVLRLVADGLSDAEVADRLFLSRRTVSTHLTSVYNKLGVSSRTAATRFAVEQGLLDPGIRST